MGSRKVFDKAKAEAGEPDIPRLLQDRANQVALIHLFKAGLSPRDAARNMNVSEPLLRSEWERDPEFYAECLEAMEDPFESVLLKAIELSESADVRGENEGALKALGYVLRFYERVLDRKQKYVLTNAALEAAAAAAPAGGGRYVIGPEGVKALLDHVAKGGATEVTGRKQTKELNE